MRSKSESRKETHAGVVRPMPESEPACSLSLGLHHLPNGWWVLLWEVEGISQPPNLAVLTLTCSGKGKAEEVVVHWEGSSHECSFPVWLNREISSLQPQLQVVIWLQRMNVHTKHLRKFSCGMLLRF